jgi:hypothetical protein
MGEWSKVTTSLHDPLFSFPDDELHGTRIHISYDGALSNAAPSHGHVGRYCTFDWLPAGVSHIIFLKAGIEVVKIKNWMAGFVLAGSLLLAAGCANWDGYAGVDNLWRAEGVPEWKPGETTADAVVKRLGPPSQLIPLHDETVYYYMREGKNGHGVMLLVWNMASQETKYDRAIFFFDAEGILKTYSYSKEVLPH